MVYKSLVLYPNEDDATFDMDYYISTHMPLVADNWKQYGLQGWEVIKLEGGLGGAKSHSSVQATLIWKDEASLGKAVGSPEAKAVFDDVPNFSNKGPSFASGSIVKEAST